MQDSRKPVGIWIRVSTEIQTDTESPEHHEKRATHYAEAKDAADDAWSLFVILGGKEASAPTDEEREEIAARVRDKVKNGI